MAKEAEPAPSKKTGFVWTLFMLSYCAFWCGLGVIYFPRLEYRLWHNLFIEPQLADARRYVLADQPEMALPLALTVVRAHPDDAGTLYFVTGLYLELNRPILAYFYLSALLTSGTYYSLSTEQKERIDILQSQGAISDIMKNSQLTAESENNKRLYDQLPDDWGTDAWPKLDVNRALNEPAQTANMSYGYIDPQYPFACKDDKICAFSFGKVDLEDAIVSQTVQIGDFEQEESCCSLAMDDPDLSSLDSAFAEFEKYRRSIGAPLRVDTKEGAFSILSFRSRVLLKQLYVQEFVSHANDYWNRTFIFASFQDWLERVFIFIALAVSIILDVIASLFVLNFILVKWDMLRNRTD